MGLFSKLFGIGDDEDADERLLNRALGQGQQLTSIERHKPTGEFTRFELGEVDRPHASAKKSSKPQHDHSRDQRAQTPRPTHPHPSSKSSHNGRHPQGRNS